MILLRLNETFRVYILLPLLPGFEGQLGATGGSALQAVLYWTYKSVSKGPHSLVGYLSKESRSTFRHCVTKLAGSKILMLSVDNYGQYLTFCSLRTHGVLCDRLVLIFCFLINQLINLLVTHYFQITELVYIHSKMIIVDDKYCLIGSANINDRSQMGKRDSEVRLSFDFQL